MYALSVRLLGGFRIESESCALPVSDAGKAQELFSFLLLHRNRPHARETLAGILWNDSPTAIARKNLRQALWNLQAVLGSYADVDCDRFLHITTEMIRVDLSSALLLDVAIIEDAYTSVRGIAGDGLTVEQAAVLKAAVTLYDGDLLEGWYQDWCVFARETVQQTYLTILDKLMVFAETHAAFEDGISFGNRILRCDIARERTHRRLMRLHYLSGDRTAALRQYERCVLALERELGVSPAQSTLRLVEEIRADRISPIPGSDRSDGSPSIRIDLANRLRDVQVHLLDLHRVIQHDIQLLEDR